MYKILITAVFLFVACIYGNSAKTLTGSSDALCNVSSLSSLVPQTQKEYVYVIDGHAATSEDYKSLRASGEIVMRFLTLKLTPLQLKFVANNREEAIKKGVVFVLSNRNIASPIYLKMMSGYKDGQVIFKCGQSKCDVNEKDCKIEKKK
ncbi:MAG TPA: hypothetical protein PK500_04845 [Candidatus Egerieousia sp.]|nr:hypothetical protein [Candidatus Egerieousia sp.]